MGAFEDGKKLDAVTLMDELEDIRADLDSRATCIYGTLEEIEGCAYGNGVDADYVADKAYEAVKDALYDACTPDVDAISGLASDGASDVENGAENLLDRLDEIIETLGARGNTFVDFRGNQKRIIVTDNSGKIYELCSFEDVGRFICDIMTNDFASQLGIQNRLDAIVKLLPYLGIGKSGVYVA